MSEELPPDLVAAVAIMVVSPESPVHSAAQLMELPFHHDAEAAHRELQQR